ncbi:hypothetical protein [Paenibacillus sp. GSMTC-2017]|nr:hypothetical protein [Paenibacillus sp. GSMTC-2017]
MIGKIGKMLVKIVTYPIVFLWSMMFDPQGNTAMLVRDIVEDRKY